VIGGVEKQGITALIVPAASRLSTPNSLLETERPSAREDLPMPTSRCAGRPVSSRFGVRVHGLVLDRWAA
jgi:hypothetical protein